MSRSAKGVKPLKGLTFTLLAVLGSLALFIPQQAEGLTWEAVCPHDPLSSAPCAVPMDTGKLTLAPYAAEDSLKRVWLAWSEKNFGVSDTEYEIFFKYLNPFTSRWTGKFQVTQNTVQDEQPFILSLSNGTMMVLWASNQTSNPDLYYRTYQSVVPIGPATQLTSHPLADEGPSAVEDKLGRVWVFWTRKNYAAVPLAAMDVMYKIYNPSTRTWTTDFLLPAASDPTWNERAPSITQTKDGKILVVWASDERTDRVLDLFYTRTDGMVDPLPAGGIPANQWNPEQLLFGSDNKYDDVPSVVQSRDGIIYVYFQRDNANDGDVAVVSSTDNGVTWTNVDLVPGASTTQNDALPAAAFMSDKRVWLFWNKQDNVCNCRKILYMNSVDIQGIHDVGISFLKGTPQFVKAGSIVNVTVSLTNYGDFVESTSLTLRVNGTILQTYTITNLTVDETRTFQYNWQSSWGRWVPNSTVLAVVGENTVNQGDNTRSGALVRVRPPGDIDADGDVDILDAAQLAFSFGSTTGSPRWNPEADLDNNGVVDILDAALLAFYFGKSV